MRFSRILPVPSVVLRAFARGHFLTPFFLALFFFFLLLFAALFPLLWRVVRCKQDVFLLFFHRFAVHGLGLGFLIFFPNPPAWSTPLLRREFDGRMKFWGSPFSPFSLDFRPLVSPTALLTLVLFSPLNPATLGASSPGQVRIARCSDFYPP